MAPISGILVADYWLVKKSHYDIPALYDPRGRYRYAGLIPGFNWRAFLAFIIPVTPLLPGLALSIDDGGTNEPSPKVATSAGLRNLYTFNWLFGFVVSIFLYTALSWVFPDRQTILTETIWQLDGLDVPIDGQMHMSDEEHARADTGLGYDSGKEKKVHESDAKPL